MGSAAESLRFHESAPRSATRRVKAFRPGHPGPGPAGRRSRRGASVLPMAGFRSAPAGSRIPASGSPAPAARESCLLERHR